MGKPSRRPLKQIFVPQIIPRWRPRQKTARVAASADRKTVPLIVPMSAQSEQALRQAALRQDKQLREQTRGKEMMVMSVDAHEKMVTLSQSDVLSQSVVSVCGTPEDRACLAHGCDVTPTCCDDMASATDGDRVVSAFGRF